MSGPLQSPTAALNLAKETGEAEDLISVARIARPQGRRGEVVAELLTDFPERFAKLSVVRLKRINGEIVSQELESHWFHKGRIVLKFAGCDSINQAEDLRGALVMVTRQQLVALPADTYYDFDLEGCEVSTVEGRHLGFVREVQRYGAAPLLVVRDEEQREFLVPFVLSICVDIDVARKRIVVNPLEGLLDL